MTIDDALCLLWQRLPNATPGYDLLWLMLITAVFRPTSMRYYCITLVTAAHDTTVHHRINSSVIPQQIILNCQKIRSEGWMASATIVPT